MWCYICFIKQKTAYEMRISDWSSDVCSADLADPQEGQRPRRSAEAEAALCGRCDLGLGEVSSGELLLADDPHGRLARVVVEPLDVEHAVEVVELVLEAAGQDVVGLDRDLVAVEREHGSTTWRDTGGMSVWISGVAGQR